MASRTKTSWLAKMIVYPPKTFFRALSNVNEMYIFLVDSKRRFHIKKKITVRITLQITLQICKSKMGYFLGSFAK